MFKENDHMRPGPTPERVLAICRLLEDNRFNQSEVIMLSQMKEEIISEESLRYSIEAARELGLIKEENNKFCLNISKDCLESAARFRRTIAPIIFSKSTSTFFKLTEWFIANSDKVMELSKFDEYAAEASKSGLKTITENDVLGWRFWMRYLGHVYQYNKTLIPNMKVRIEDCLVGIEKNTHMSCIEFVLWLKKHIPEASVSCTNAQLPLAVSNGLRTLYEEGKIDLISTKDAIRTALYPIRGMGMNDFSDIVIKEI